LLLLLAASRQDDSGKTAAACSKQAGRQAINLAPEIMPARVKPPTAITAFESGSVIALFYSTLHPPAPVAHMGDIYDGSAQEPVSDT